MRFLTVTVNLLKNLMFTVLDNPPSRPSDINIAQISHLSNFWFIYSFTSIANQNRLTFSYSISYFTNIVVQNVNKVFVYITDF